MKKISIVYYSFTGNVYRMMQAFEKGLKEANANFHTYKIAEVDVENLFDSDLIVMASPANGTEQIEQTYFQPFMDQYGERFRNKKIFLFGSYGWGGGKYLLDWKESLEKLGGIIVAEPISSNGSPNSEMKQNLFETAKKLAISDEIE